MQHYAIFLSNTFNKQSFIQQLLDKKAKGLFASFNTADAVLFSAYTIQQFLLEEEIHGYSGIEATRKQSLRSMSSGEQKKVLLQHLLSMKPHVLILDNLFDNLDTAAQASFKEAVEKASANTQIIELRHR